MFGCFSSASDEAVSVTITLKLERTTVLYAHRQISELTFHKTDLSNGGRRRSFLWIQMNLLQRDNLLRLPIPALRDESKPR